MLLSCRVIGRKVEDRIVEKVCELFRDRGLKRIVGEFIPARKNQQVAGFYENHGFVLIRQTEDGTKQYERTLA